MNQRNLNTDSKLFFILNKYYIFEHGTVIFIVACFFYMSRIFLVKIGVCNHRKQLNILSWAQKCLRISMNCLEPDHRDPNEWNIWLGLLPVPSCAA
jgi:hypothetical protein